jgi:predicted HNH restriction endonuclease
MKNIKILVLIFTIILLCGCTKEEENKLVKYLTSINYDCLKNVCAYESTESNVKVKSVFDIDNHLYKKETTFSSNQSSTLEYDWSLNEVDYNYKVLDDDFDVTYNLDTKKYDCVSNSDNDTYEKAQCKHLKEDIEEEVEIFNSIIDASGEKIK